MTDDPSDADAHAGVVLRIGGDATYFIPQAQLESCRLAGDAHERAVHVLASADDVDGFGSSFQGSRMEALWFISVGGFITPGPASNECDVQYPKKDAAMIDMRTQSIQSTSRRLP